MGKDGDKPKKKKKKGGKKKKGAGGPMDAFKSQKEAVVVDNPNERLKRLDDALKSFPEDWKPFSDAENVAQIHNVEVIREDIRADLRERTKVEAKKNVAAQLKIQRVQCGLDKPKKSKDKSEKG